MSPHSPSRSQHSLITIQDDEENQATSFPRYCDDENASSEGDALIVDEGAALLRPDDDEVFSDGDGQDIPSDRLKHHWARFVHPRIRRAAIWVARWTKGPTPPRIYKIRPFLASVQKAPVTLLDRHLPKRKHKIALLVLFYLAWFLTFTFVLKKSAFSADIPGWGSPVRLSCTSSYWSKGNGCGLDGDQCRPFANSTLTFRCPANCLRVKLLNPYAIGDQEANYRPLVIGGPANRSEPISSADYRGDSFICGSAIHAGFISNEKGGCGVLSLNGERANYTSTKAHGITSFGFNSYFPLSFSFMKGTTAKCQDLRWPLLGVSLTFTILISLFTTSPGIFFWSLWVGLFFHVALVSDPPELNDYYSIVSLALGRFLPASFCAFAVYKYCTIRQLSGLTAQYEKTILWLGACWVGCLNNYTFDRIPIQRLTPSDIKAEPGAIPALIIVVLVILVIALGQAWAIRREGRMRRYLVVYGIFVAGLLILVAIPKMNLRIHHYILALLLVPGTAMQNRPSLLYQGLLVGLFINGIARWGFDSILQTPDELRGDGQLHSPLPAITVPPIIHNNSGSSLAGNITFDFSSLEIPRKYGYEGISVLVNDVERFRSYDGGKYGDSGHGGVDNFTWVRHEEGVPEYFRFAFMTGSSAGDYTKAGIWTKDGDWTKPKSGPSK